MDSLSMLINAEQAIDKVNVSLKVRRSHLKNQGRSDPETDELLSKTEDLKEYIVDHAAVLLKEHPAYPWFSRILGVGRENIGKCLGPIRVKPADEFVCKTKGCRNRRPKNGEAVPPKCPKCKQLMQDPPYADTISALWKFCGSDVGENGKAPKRTPGVTSSFNSQLRSMWWRLGVSLLKAGLRQKCLKCGALVGQGTLDLPENNGLCPKCRQDKFETVATSRFAKKYLDWKEMYVARFTNAGYKIVPAEELPKDKEGKRYEPEGVISEGHIHNMALRRVVKLFQACLWLTWREAEGLPVTKPYAIEKLGHNSFIDPWEMCDRE